MKKIVPECNNYVIDNPHQHKEPFRYTFMRSAFNKYKELKIALSEKFPNKFPLKEWQKHMWKTSYPFDDGDNSAQQAINPTTNTIDEAFFNLEFIHILELIPKEQLDVITAGIDGFKSKHCSNRLDRLESADHFKVYWSGEAFSSLGSMSIRKDSDIYMYISQISFSLINITNSFCVLSIMVQLNNDLKSDISNFITSHIDNKVEVLIRGEKWF